MYGELVVLCLIFVLSFRKFFPPGETVIFDGQDYVCEDCDYGADPASRQPLHSMFLLYLSYMHTVAPADR